METLDRIKDFEGKKFGLLLLYLKPKGVSEQKDIRTVQLETSKKPLVDLEAYGETRIVETTDFFALYFRGNGVTN